MKHLFKKTVSLALVALLAVGLFAGCGSAESTPTTTAPAPTEDPNDPIKILTFGNSATVDDCHMLNLVAGAEGFTPELYIGTLYYSGCTLAQHVDFAKTNSNVYNLYLSSSNTPNEPPTIMQEVSSQQALRYTDWDIVILQGSSATNAVESTFSNGNIQTLQKFINENALKPNLVFAWNLYQVPPEDVELQTMYETQTGRPPEDNVYKKNYLIYPNREVFYNTVLENIKKYIITDDTFSFLIPTGTAVENALTSYLTEKDIHRDYTHLSDFSRVIASYVWYCTLANVDHLDEIKLDTIPKAFLKSTQDKTQDRVLTDIEKAIILESVNSALAKPLELTPSQYTEAPAQ